ncbi:LysR substrate-binding domain-containing protein [Raoultibacter phocaeensis]|uniref:LysR substrate-binding domain-containing protein n=1 Tax=Raoultibacter phocaeensis TaxID=2479841 RepID=UPI00111A0850|nr:LysR substrate-binding domain-containing protein [Raoultibacter phocaeensis]
MQDFRTETFLDVCETLSYTRSAQRLNITQPAVSQHISFLESAYGTKLFRYRNRRLELTDAGKVLRDALAVMVHDERLVKELIASLSGGRRSLGIGVTMTAGEYVIAKPLARFLKQRPDLQAKIVASDTDRLLGMLRDGTLDCAFVEGFFDKNEYDWEVFCAERLVAVCAPNHRFAATPQYLEDLLGEHLLVRESGSGTRAVLEHALGARNLVPASFARTTEVTSLGIIKTLVEADYGIAFLYEPAVRMECEAGTLRIVELEDTPIAHDMTFIWLKGSFFSDEFRGLIAELEACAL